jgi:hypothetical protein
MLHSVREILIKWPIRRSFGEEKCREKNLIVVL